MKKFMPTVMSSKSFLVVELRIGEVMSSLSVHQFLYFSTEFTIS